MHFILHKSNTYVEQAQQLYDYKFHELMATNTCGLGREI